MPSKSKTKNVPVKAQSNGTNQSTTPVDARASEALKKITPPLDYTSSASQHGQTISSSQNQHSAISRPTQGSQDTIPAEPTVNRKKQKRRMKEAARKATLETSPAKDSNESGESETNGYESEVPCSGSDQYGAVEGADPYYSEMASEGRMGHGYDPFTVEYGDANHSYIVQEPSGMTKKKSKKDKNGIGQAAAYSTSNIVPRSGKNHLPRPPPPPPPPPLASHSNSIATFQGNEGRDRIWNTSTAEERERIKEFWLGLGESERRGLVRIEKEAVLKKMKEQQKHSCSCTVCGRKRTAIEEELEVLYDAYYDELETYANHQHFGLDATTLPPPRAYDRRRAALPSNQQMNIHTDQHSAGGHIEELDEVDEELYSDENEDDDISEDELEPALGPPAGGIFSFGNSLTAQGGILTVADDLLKNDGKKFIEMMEQLAERRMQREEESRMVASGMGHPSMRHAPEEEEDDGYDDDEDDEDYNSEEEDEYEDEEMEALSEEQRMEEGRRMFQIFAARMFEQRVLNAYRQKVAEERQKKLIEELAEDEQLDAQKEAKRAKEAQKKKDKRQKQKQAKDEERAKKEAEKAAEEAAARALEERKAEEQRQRKEEQRKKKEAEKKAAEEERKRKEEDKQRQIRERKHQQAELERKQREQRDKEKQKREEAKAKEREEREAKEKEKKEREAKAKADSAIKQRIKQDEASSRPIVTVSKQHSPAPMPTLTTQTSLQRSHTPSAHASPRLPIATPILPQPPTPGRIRQRSVQDSRNASPKLSQPTSSSTASPATSSEQNHLPVHPHSRKPSNTGPRQALAQPSHFSPINAPPGFSSHPPGLSGPTPPLTNGFNSSYASPVSPASHGGSIHQPPGFHDQNPVASAHWRNPSAPYPPGFNPPRHLATGQQGPISTQGLQGYDSSSFNTQVGPPGRFSTSNEAVVASSHSRNQSTSSNQSPRDQTHRPAPIQRPSSVAPSQQRGNRSTSKDVDDLSGQLGSSALLDDTDDAADSAIEDLRRGSVAVGGPRRQGAFGSAPGIAPIGVNTRVESGQASAHKMWTTPQTPFAAPGIPTQPFMPTAGFGRPHTGNAFGTTQASSRSGAPRLSRVRALICDACSKLSHFNPMNQGWHLADQVVGEVQSSMPRHEPLVQIMEVLSACDVDGNDLNGGGYFDFRGRDSMGFVMKHYPGNDGPASGRSGLAPGDFGSPRGMLYKENSGFTQAQAFEVGRHRG